MVFISKSISLIAYISGAGALLWFAVFLLIGSFSVWDLGLDGFAVLLFDSGLSLLFFLQHSIMARKGFRARLGKYLARHHLDSVYILSSALALFMVLVTWQKSSSVLFSAGGGGRLAFRMLYVAAIAGFFWGSRSLRLIEGGDIRTRLVRGGSLGPGAGLMIRGPYKYVRHPLYFFSLLMIWSCPDITADRLLFNVLWSGWIVIGAWLEEKDLVRDLGRKYRDYQKKVPMLIPWKALSRR